VILHLVISRLVKSSGAAALINNILWILFFTIRVPYLFIVDFFALDILAVYVSIMTVITITAVFLIIRYKNKLQKQEIYKLLSVFWLVVFILNATPSLVYAIKSNTKYIGDDKNYKTEFTIDSSLPNPNIYWLLMDGMLGFKAMEHLFNDSQPEFIAQLTERGFIVNQDAQFEGLHATIFCIPALMCPHFYDASFVPSLQMINLLDYEKKLQLRDSYNEFRMSSKIASRINELITAFGKKGYQTSAISSILAIYNSEFFYYRKTKIEENNTKINMLDNMDKLYSMRMLLYTTTLVTKLAFILNPLLESYSKYKYESIGIPESLADRYESFYGETYQGNDKYYLDALDNIINSSGPKLVIIHDLKAHDPFRYDEFGKIIKRNNDEALDPYHYPSQHNFAAKIVIAYIDYILNIDSEAVIILQSDHGIHGAKPGKKLISKYGKNDEDVRLMQNQTISAVRIPEKWGGLDQPIEPPNITRLLVNRYVGENYTLLSSDDIIK
jgi:hypothetical protein